LVSASLPEKKFACLLSDLNRALSVAAVRISFTKHVAFILIHPWNLFMHSCNRCTGGVTLLEFEGALPEED
jgi:hypothetical protein